MQWTARASAEVPRGRACGAVCADAERGLPAFPWRPPFKSPRWLGDCPRTRNPGMMVFARSPAARLSGSELSRGEARVPFIDELPSKAEIFDHWKDKLGAFGILIDWNEPSCWACGFHYGTKYDIRRPNAAWSKILKGWNAIPLQRCHITPRSLGGTNEPDNLF